MKFELHPNAVAAFNEQANVLSESVIAVVPPQRQPQGFKPDVHVSSRLTSADTIGPIQTSSSDQDGNKIARFETDESSTVGFGEEAYLKLRQLAQKIQKTDSFKNAISTQFIEDELFRWSLQKIKGNTTKTVCEYIIAQANEKVSQQEIWVPVYGLNIQSAFGIGKVNFKTITRAMIDDWHGRISAKVPDNPQVNFRFDRDRKALLGFAAATVAIEAEPMRAKEVAQDLADKAISLLRLFSAANFDPKQFSYCLPLGSHQRIGHHLITVENGQIVSDSRGITGKGQYPWLISDSLLNEFMAAGLAILGKLFDIEPKNELEQTVFDALMLYSNAALVPPLAEKLLYMFAALESILLRDEKESVTEAVAERLAYVAADDPDSRIAVKKSVKKAYGVRSRFVHHGKREDDDLSIFFMHSWTGLMRLAERASRHKTKIDLLDELERYKYRS